MKTDKAYCEQVANELRTENASAEVYKLIGDGLPEKYAIYILFKTFEDNPEESLNVYSEKMSKKYGCIVNCDTEEEISLDMED